MAKSAKKENPFVSLIFNIALPNFILLKLANEQYLGNVNGFCIALAFPLSYGIYDFIVRKNYNVIAILGFVSVLLTGGIGILKLGGIWFAIKEAAIPAVIGLAILLTQKSKKPLIRTVLYNDQILNIERIETALGDAQGRQRLDELLKEATVIIFGSFMFSAVVNFLLAMYLIKSPPVTDGFNEQVGTMNLVSMGVIAVPCTIMLAVALWKFGKGLRELTHLEWHDILTQQ